MKTSSFLIMLITFSILLFLESCCDNDVIPEPHLEIIINEPDYVTETSFMANWSVNRTDIKTILIKISFQDDFNDVFKIISLSNPTAKNQLIDGLTGATTYYYKITVILNDNSSESSSSSIRTSYQQESINVFTSDGIEIKGELFYLNNNIQKRPVVILMGHFSLSNFWQSKEVFYQLVAQGYICCLFNYRGHGKSDPWPISNISTPEQLGTFVSKYARNDLLAIYTYIKTHEKIDSTAIALMGGSLGANESMIGNNWPGVKCSVGLCTSRLGIEGAVLNNVFFISSEHDCNSWVCFNDEAETLYNSAKEPKKILIIPGSAHGLDMLDDINLENEIMDWINKRLKD